MTADLFRWVGAGVAVLLWLGLIALTVWRVRAAARRAAEQARAFAEAAGDEAVLIAFASQTGFGEELAWMTARALGDGGVGARILPFAELDLETLKRARRLLVVASTTGEGDAPDGAARFVRQAMGTEADLSHLSYGLLALGDRSYDAFCGFGRAVGDWLDRCGAQTLFDRVEVDNGDAGAVRHWQHQLNLITGATAAPDWTPPAYDRWRLVKRTLLNAGSPGGEAWHLAFEPIDHAPDWAAGDIAEVGLPARDGEQPGSREYSVASLPSDGRLELCIRLMTRPDGTPGLASGWLTQEAQIGQEVALRVRANRSFHAPPPEVPIILIGNGTGIAGLRGHLKARARHDKTGGGWLLFGERTRAHDAFYDEELRAWRASGVLTRLDRAFSRDGGEHRYVQALVAEHARTVADWVDRGAWIYVCGSLEGMSKGVHAALEAALGEDRLLGLTEAGRYRRDVY
ncbi:oxidoreductase [Brevundimonas naejangsanensis]|uniref:NADPH--hemoprotein reductase n=1 Tax=Brevundimonas naejangsanensis TaxID=588932 RepID=A0A494RIW2_9CAUL|nr:sulfite reductase subunit alpha [Brevundimonas naejangsanensis]AYG94983.1 oxidoreductase [Brevundimonas naejangsanensis]